MRDIKFRYFNAASKLIYPNQYYAVDLDGNFLMSMPLPKDYKANNPEDRLFTKTELHSGDRLMQYTGLKDKNGVEIYEGDIIRYDGSKDNIAEVVFNNIKAAYMCKPKGRYSGSIPEYSLDVRCEVIGNIYENKELLNDTAR